MTLTLATHSGTFHADDAMAYAVLRLALGLAGPGEDHVLLRTRDAGLLAEADIVWDVGARFEPSAGRFDHHQRGAPVREDGTPYSALGLVWRHYGLQAVERTLLNAESPSAPAATDARTVRTIAEEIDRDIVREVDLLDNGIQAPQGTLGFVSLVEDYNCAWDRPELSLSSFLQASNAAMGILQRRIDAVRARTAAVSIVAEAATRSADPAILELDVGAPWQMAAFRLGLPCVYAVFPARTGEWMVGTLPTKPGGVEPKMPFPASWGGLRGAALQKESGVADAVFVHQGLFIAAAESRMGALAIARKSIALAPEPWQGWQGP